MQRLLDSHQGNREDVMTAEEAPCLKLVAALGMVLPGDSWEQLINNRPFPGQPPR